MATFLYECTRCQAEIETEHSVHDRVYDLLCPKCGHSSANPKRLIAGRTVFRLATGGVGWAHNSYSGISKEFKNSKKGHLDGRG